MRETQSIPLDAISTSGRLRLVDPDRALLLASNIEAEGLQVPVEVRATKKDGRFQLVTGAHRVEAVRLLQWASIDAVVLAINADEARMREIDENLYRAELTELDRAVFLAEKKRLYEKMHPQTRHGGDRKSDQAAILGGLISRFSTDACERLGLSERTLQRVLKRAALPADVRARISGTPVANKGADLDALLKLPPGRHHQVLDLLLDTDGEDAPRSITEAMQRLSGARGASVSDSDAKYDALLKAWKRADAPARARFEEFLAEQFAEEDAA